MWPPGLARPIAKESHIPVDRPGHPWPGRFALQTRQPWRLNSIIAVEPGAQSEYEGGDGALKHQGRLRIGREPVTWFNYSWMTCNGDNRISRCAHSSHPKWAGHSTAWAGAREEALEVQEAIARHFVFQGA